MGAWYLTPQCMGWAARARLALMAAQERRWRAALPVWREPMVAVRDAYVVWIGGTGGRA
jgi:hypothetical protein